MKTKWIKKLFKWLIVLVIFLGCGSVGVKGVGTVSAAGPSKKIKILHIMSYHMPWKWTEDQLKGFKYALKDLDIEYKVFQMDTKRRSSESWKKKVGEKARSLIDSWKPDLVYTSDDNAQEYVARYYINKGIPFVFSGVNMEPEYYGYTASETHTGVLEQEHFVPTVNLLKEIVPSVKRIAVIFDKGPTWLGVEKRIHAQKTKLPDVRFTRFNVIETFDQYKKTINALHDEVDALALLGIFTFKDSEGKNVPYQKVLRWTAENSRLPDFGFWKDRILYGTLCAVTVSGYRQGLAAGIIARGILLEGRKASSFKMRPTVKGEPVISLARAKMMNIKVKARILLSAEVVQKFEWEN